MRYRWFRGAVPSLGILVMGLLGGTTPLAQAADAPAPIFQPYPPVEAPPAAPAPAVQPAKAATEAAPVASLDRPVALKDDAPRVDQQVQPTGLFSNRNVDSIMFSPDSTFGSARSLSVGMGNASAMPAATPILSSPTATPVLTMPTPMPAAPPPPDVPYSWKQPPAASPVSSNLTSAPSNLASPPSNLASAPIVSSPTVTAMPGSVTSPVNGPVGAPFTDTCGMDGTCGSAGICGDGMCCGDGPGCGDGCCGGNCWGNCCNGCCFGNRWYASAEYLLWWIRGQSVPPLLTSGSVADNPPGALGQPGTTVLFGGGNLANNPYSGVRLRAGYWFGDQHCLGLEIGGFILGGNPNRFSESSMGSPFLARPFYNAVTGAQDIEAVATPNGLSGTFSAVSTFFLYGAEANLRHNFLCGCNWYVDGFVGWRLLGLNEGLTINENLAVINSTNPNLPVGSTFNVSDRFATNNLFNGAQIGGVAEYRLGRWFANVRGSVGLGGTQQTVNISGSTTSAAPGIAPTTSVGGLLAQSSNIGNYSRGVVSFVDEVTLNLGYQFTPHIRGFVGYNFLYWTGVVRPGNVIDSTVNPNLIPPANGMGGPARPTFNFNSTNFWAQGINFGLQFIW